MTVTFPALEALGDCILGTVQFTTDPGRYSPLKWDKDASVYLGVTSKTIQDFGIIPGQVVMASDEHRPLDTATMLALHALFRQAVDSTGLRFRDGFGSDFQVFVLDFKPEYREAGLWDYTMTLEILSIAAFFGAAWTG